MYVEYDGVVDSDAHEHADEVIVALVALLPEGEPVESLRWVVHEHFVFRLLVQIKIFYDTITRQDNLT